MGASHFALCPFDGIGGGIDVRHHLFLQFDVDRIPVDLERRAIYRPDQNERQYTAFQS